MSRTILLVAILCIAVAFATPEKTYQDAFVSFMGVYHKMYKHDEFFHRYSIFKSNYDYITNINAQKLSFSVGINQFADLTNQEFNQLYKGYNSSRKIAARKTPAVPSPKVTCPSGTQGTCDWTAAGVVTGIKNQGQCGSCWSFSTTGSLEGQYALLGHPLTGLSEQQLVDCSTSYGNDGCNGGLMDNAFQYVEAYGLESEAFYPYTATGPNTCVYNAADLVLAVHEESGYTDVPSGSETALTNDVTSKGPVSVAIDASHSSFQFYTSGVYYEPACSSTQLDHGVLAVGWGTTTGTYPNYYVVKNSWGISWGANGYIWMARNQNNNCGIATEASYPTLAY